jgi:hypothetical protein
MNSAFAQIFKAIQARIQQQVPAIKYIDQDLGQLTQQRPPVSWPCALIDMDDFSYSCLSDNTQCATGTVTISLGWATHSGSAYNTPTEVTAQSLAYYELEWQLNKALHGWRPGAAFGSLARVAAATRKKTGGCRVRELCYSLAFEDYSTKPEINLTAAGADITIMID